MGWYGFCWIDWNGLIPVSVIWINVNRVGIFVIPNYIIFAPNIFNFNIIFALSILEFLVTSKVFTFICAMPWRSPVGNIRLPSGGAKDVTVACNVRLWDRGHDGSLWVHPSAVINIPLGSGNISTIIQNSDGGYYWSLCPGPVAWLKWTTVGWIVGSVQFSVWVLNGFAIPTKNFTDPPISVGNKTWVAVHVIIFLVIIFPSGVVNGGDGSFLR